MMKEHILTEEDFKNNPDFYEMDLKVGDTISYTDYEDVETIKIEVDGQEIEVKSTMTVTINGEEKFIVSKKDFAMAMDWLNTEEDEMDV